MKPCRLPIRRHLKAGPQPAKGVTELLPWRFAYASTQGRSHIAGDVVCQDSSGCTLLDLPTGPVLIATVSDGAGSAARSEIGSGIACASFRQEMTALLTERDGRQPSREDIEVWLKDFCSLVEAEAERLGLSSRDLACTFVGAVVAPTWSAACQVGDGGIVIGLPSPDGSNEFEVVFWPEQGEYANETYFATMSGASEHLQFKIDDRPIREIALFSDGLQRMVLKYETRDAFGPFFHRMLQTVRRADGVGVLPELSRELGTYLSSPTVSDRTDDDVSLILATRSAELPDPPPPPPPVPPPAPESTTDPTSERDEAPLEEASPPEPT